MYINYDIVSDNVGKVSRIIFNPTIDDKKIPGVEVEGDVVPTPNGPPNFTPVLMIELTENRFYYDYIAPESVESIIHSFRTELSTLQRAVDELSLGGIL